MTDARKLLAPLEDDVIRLVGELVRIDTVAVPPHGRETAGQEKLRDFLAAHDVEAELYDVDFVPASGHPCARHDRDYRGRRNLVARIAGTGRGRSLLLNGHMDTVPAGRAAWAESPWSGAERDGRMYGRGSFDMKGGLAAAFAVACALRRAGIRTGGDLICESVVDEEWGGGGGTLAGRLRGDCADACAIPEGTQLEIALATRGGYVADLVCSAGDPAHFFSTAEVVSPAVHLGRLLGWLDGWAARRRKIDRGEAFASFEDPAPVQVLAIEANRVTLEEPLTVPLTATVRAYFQFLPHEDVNAVIAQIRTSLAEFSAADPFSAITLRSGGPCSTRRSSATSWPLRIPGPCACARARAPRSAATPWWRRRPTPATLSWRTANSASRPCCSAPAAAARTIPTNTSRSPPCCKRPRRSQPPPWPGAELEGGTGMTATDFWWYFWLVWFAVAGLSFAGIAAVVMVRGVGDLRDMIRLLEERARQGGGTE